ncbi:UNVERIFIED_CONTAM: hypothetical protein PYX00_002881 [Menopon gallinae]|uniref:Ribosomal biogenesis protein LAS1L n=1 Tax=Menopon gallinae TaxID=328185 RepID=A0AAW2HZJ4_9NEOP
MEKQKTTLLVPWVDRSEWKDVRLKLLSDKFEDKIEAYKIMSMWKLRGDTIPAFVEITASILQVLVEDYNSGTNPQVNDYSLRLAYATSLIRFVNHVHNLSEFKGTTLYRAAKTQNIPDWLITIRHDAAHGRELPSIETFELAAKASFQWLLEYYWLHEEISLHHLESNFRNYGDEVLKYKINFSLLPIFVIAFKIWGVLSDSLNNSLKKLSDLSKDQVFRHYVQDLVNACEGCKNIPDNAAEHLEVMRKVFVDHKSSRTQKACSLISMQNNIIDFIRCMGYDDTSKYTLIQALMQSDFMLDTTQKHWKRVIFLIQSLKYLTPFLELLFELAGEDNDMALGLLNSLLPAIQILKERWPSYKNVCNSTRTGEELEILKNKARKKYASRIKKCSLPLHLQAPPSITMSMVYKLLLNPSQKSRSVIFRSLRLVEPPVPEVLMNDVRQLVSVYCDCNNSKEDIESDKIYTLEDVVNCLEKEGTIFDDKMEEEVPVNTAWTRSNIGAEDWSSCPLGLLPHQKSVDLKVPNMVKWRQETSPSQRKRPFTSVISQSAEMKKLRKYLKVNRQY